MVAGGHLAGARSCRANEGTHSTGASEIDGGRSPSKPGVLWKTLPLGGGLPTRTEQVEIGKALFADEGCAWQAGDASVKPADADAADDWGDQIADDEGHPVNTWRTKEDADNIRAECALRVQ